MVEVLSMMHIHVCLDHASDSSGSHQRRLLQINDSDIDGSTYMNITAVDSDTYNKLTDEFRYQMAQDLEVEYLEQLDIDLKSQS